MYNASALQLVTTYLPLATSANGHYLYGPPNPNTEHQFIGRVDWNKSQKQTLFTRYYITHYFQQGFFNNNLLNTTNPQLNDQEQSLTLGHTYSISSNLVNSFHVSGTRSRISRGQVSSLITPKTIGINVATPVPNYIYMAVSGDFTVSCGTCETYQVTTNSENAVDDIFWTRGKHHFGVGGNFIHNHMNLQGTNNANGQFSFNGSFTGDALADFMLGDLFSLYQGNDTGSTFAKNAFAFYAQDSYQLSPRLTVNAGVRWESDLPEVETAGRGDSFSMAAFMAGQHLHRLQDRASGTALRRRSRNPQGLHQQSLGLISNRASASPGIRAARAARASARPIRSGFPNPSSTWKTASKTMRPTATPSPSIPRPGRCPIPLRLIPAAIHSLSPIPPPKDTAFFPTGGSYFLFPVNMKPSYTQTWNLTVQKQIGSNWEATAAYLGNHVVHIPSGNEENPAVYIPGNWTGPGSCGSLTIAPGPNGTACSSGKNTNQRRVTALANPTAGAYYSEISYMYDGSSSVYDGLLLTVQHRFAQHFTLLTNYTWSHCITGGTDVGDLGGNTFQNPADPGAERSNCGEDIRHNFVTSMVARSDLKHGGIMQTLLGGWQVAPIVTVASGTRVSPTTGTDASLTGVGVDRPNLAGDPYCTDRAAPTGSTRLRSRRMVPAPTATPSRSRLWVPPTPISTAPSAVSSRCPKPCNSNSAASASTASITPTCWARQAALNSSLFGKITTADPPRILQLSLKVDF